MANHAEEAGKDFGMSFEEFQSMEESMPVSDPSYDPGRGDEGTDQDNDYDPDYGDDAEYDDDHGSEETAPRQDIAASHSNHEKTHEVKRDLEFEI